MMLPRRWLTALSALALLAAPTAAQDHVERGTALDELGRRTAAFRAGDIVLATHRSEAVRVCHQIGASDIEAQALSRHREAYGVEGYFLDARRDLEQRWRKPRQAAISR
jgi:hypothetical protein